MSYSQVRTLRLTELRYQVGNGRVGGTLYPSSFIWTHKLFSVFFKIIHGFMHVWQVERSFEAYNYLAMILIIVVYHFPGSLFITVFFSVGGPPLWDGFLTRISLSSLRTSLLSGGKWFFCFSDLCMTYCSCFMSVFRGTIRPGEVISHQLSGRPTSFHELAA